MEDGRIISFTEDTHPDTHIYILSQNLSFQETRRYNIKKCILRVLNASPLECRTRKIGFRFQPIESGLSTTVSEKGFILVAATNPVVAATVAATLVFKLWLALY